MNYVWSRNPAIPLLWRRWDEETVVYDDASGDTHLLDEVTMTLLLRVAAGPVSDDAVIEQAAATLEIEADAAFAQRARQSLDQLETFGLIDRAEQ